MCYGPVNTYPEAFEDTYVKASGMVLDDELGRRHIAPVIRFRLEPPAPSLTLSMVVRMSASDASQKAIGNLGWTDIKLVAPVFVRDTTCAESEVLAKRQSASHPTRAL